MGGGGGEERQTRIEDKERRTESKEYGQKKTVQDSVCTGPKIICKNSDYVWDSVAKLITINEYRKVDKTWVIVMRTRNKD